MTIRNLDFAFKPKSVALIGASTRTASVGAVLAQNLVRGRFTGPVMPVNPKHGLIEGVRTYADVASLPTTPDLAVISTPPQVVPEIIAQLGARGTKAAVVITAGFGGSEPEHAKGLRQALLDAARPHLVRIIGPNCLGIMIPGTGLNASFAHIHPSPGALAFVAQSGAIVTSVLDWAHARGIGFSHLVSLGDMVDVDFGDMLAYLANDPGTRAILLYIEAISSARKFMSAARAAARMKPVIVVKAGRHAEGARAVASHTGALAGVNAVYAAALALIRVAQLVIDIGEISELDINPLLADAYGVVVLDARIAVARATEPASARLAILPYPRELEENVPLADGRELWLRPILLEDEPSLQAGFAKLTPEEIRLRFFVPLKAPTSRPRVSRRSTTTGRWRWC